MKITYLIYLSLLVTILVLTGCDYDNYAPPSSRLTGRVIYGDTPIGVRSNAVELELWQHGYADFEKIPVSVAQDGSFSAKLFDGHYKLTLRNGNGPWVSHTDSIDVNVSGNVVVDVPVQPYYMITAEGFVKNGNDINATLHIEEVTGTHAVESVTLFVGTTSIVDAINHANNNATKPGAEIDIDSPIAMSVTLNATLQAKPYVYVRAGVKIVGVVEMIYTPVQKIDL